GADAAVQSTHKMLTSLTMGAMLHVQGNRIDRGILRQRLAMLQSSSPSYPIMASLDLSRRLMHTEGYSLVETALHRVYAFHQQLTELCTVLEVLPPAPSPAYESLDPFKIAVRAADRSLSGYQLQQELEGHGCIVEMADPEYVLLALSPVTSDEELARAIEAFRRIAVTLSVPEPERVQSSTIIEETQSNQTDRHLFVSQPVYMELPAVNGNGHDADKVELANSVNRIAAEMIIPYPPGIPVLYPGELITARTVAYLTRLAELGARFQGCRDLTLRTVLVHQQ
ncbi:MAG: amino acid decarboxylase, partial [Paenibacillus sp.]|nr:amino acid decarboxylase [Paenibacillus sp.]